MKTNSVHHNAGLLGRKHVDRDSIVLGVEDKQTFAGLPASRTEASQFLRLVHEPVPLAKIGLQLSGGLFSDSLFLDRAAIQCIASPVLGKAAKMFLEFGVGAAYTVLRVSKTDSEIFVLGTNVNTTADRARFSAEVDNCLQRVSDEFRLISELAEMPADNFMSAWFDENIRPDPNSLPALRAALDLDRTLRSLKVILTMDGEPVTLPVSKQLATKKRAGAMTNVAGTLLGVDANPGSVVVKIDGAHTVSVRATGKGYVDQLNKRFRIGDLVSICYEPVVDLLQPFKIYPSKGTLLEIEQA